LLHSSNNIRKHFDLRKAKFKRFEIIVWFSFKIKLSITVKHCWLL